MKMTSSWLWPMMSRTKSCFLYLVCCTGPNICVVCTILILLEEYMLQYIRCQNTYFQLFQKAHNRTVLEPEDYWLCHGTMRFQNTKMYVNQHEIDANICNTSINFLFHVSDLCSCGPLVLHTVVANTTYL
jgi:hypothetical protein